MERTGVDLPLRVSHASLVDAEWPLGPAWLTPGGGWEPGSPDLPMMVRDGNRSEHAIGLGKHR